MSGGSVEKSSGGSAASTLFEQVYRRYRRVLLKYFHRHAIHHGEVEELVQETYLRLITNPHGAELEHAEGYLFTIASNLVRDWHRTRLTREALAGAVLPAQRSGEGTESIDAERIVAAREDARRVAAALASLPVLTRDIFLLNRFEQVPYRTLARHYQTTVAEIRKHMSLAFRALDEAIGR
jgi:RNA polymerase sigma factor (sigma-70 family)